MNRYKYHYIITTKEGQVIDTAQDQFMLHSILTWLCKYHGYTYASSLKVNKKRIGIQDWKLRYC